MTSPQELSDKLKSALGENLRSVVLYGSAAAGEQTKKYSDFNILVVVKDMGLSALKSAMPVVKKWTKGGNPPPLFFTEERIKQAEDVFPIEFLDIKSSNKVLSGEDPFSGLRVPTANLRHQLEYELRGKLIQLRERYLSTEGKPKQVQELLARSISTFSILFRAVLWLVKEKAPTKRNEVINALKKHVAIDAEALQTILRIRENDKAALSTDPERLLEGLLASVEAVVDFVDKYK